MNEYQDRKQLTFEQAEGAVPLPSQLQPKQISRQLRALLWDVIYRSMSEWEDNRRYDNTPNFWREILYNIHVFRDHMPADDYIYEEVKRDIKIALFNGDYTDALGTVQWILRDEECPPGLADEVEESLRRSWAAYSVLDSSTIVPVGSGAERETLERAFADVASTEFNGARTHLRNAAEELTAGRFPESIRESIHAVESVARVLEPSATTLGPAFTKLEKSVTLHPAFRAGLDKLYAFTNDEKGIRHALLEAPAARVDETDALYMLGSCAAFVSYLINKARNAGLIV